jgi:hypothetical protein
VAEWAGLAQAGRHLPGHDRGAGNKVIMI